MDGQERNLMPNGANIKVTDQNKKQFVKLKCESIAIK